VRESGREEQEKTLESRGHETKEEEEEEDGGEAGRMAGRGGCSDEGREMEESDEFRGAGRRGGKKREQRAVGRSVNTPDAICQRSCLFIYREMISAAAAAAAVY